MPADATLISAAVYVGIVITRERGRRTHARADRASRARVSSEPPLDAAEATIDTAGINIDNIWD